MKEVLGRPGTDLWWWRDLRCQLIKDRKLVRELESVRAQAGADHLSLLLTFDIMCWMFAESGGSDQGRDSMACTVRCGLLMLVIGVGLRGVVRMEGTKAGDGTGSLGGTGSVDKAKPKERFQRLLKGFFGFFDSSMRATVLGAVLLSGLVWAYHQITTSPPPSTSTVTSLMTQEATAAETHNTALVKRIYSPDAVVTDAACQTPGASQTWKGYGQLDARYGGLFIRYLWLQHIFAQVTWDPNNSSASAATATAVTAGVLVPASSHAKPQSIVGRELWTFAIVDGQWRITSFTYDMCAPPGIGG